MIYSIKIETENSFAMNETINELKKHFRFKTLPEINSELENKKETRFVFEFEETPLTPVLDFMFTLGRLYTLNILK